MTDAKPTTKPTWEPPWMAAKDIYPDDPVAAEALENARDQRMLQTTTSEPPDPAPPEGLTPNEILHWSGKLTVQEYPPPEPPSEEERPKDGTEQSVDYVDPMKVD